MSGGELDFVYSSAVTESRVNGRWVDEIKMMTHLACYLRLARVPAVDGVSRVGPAPTPCAPKELQHVTCDSQS